jgi:C4-dicarboxylate-specific signal transduction histidine kinase
LTVAARLLHLNEIQLICELAEDLPAVLADRIQIEQVVLNLIRNALEAMWQTPAPERKLTVKTERADESMLRATVSDSGCGLPPDADNRLFRPFFTTKSAGMGMGLAISRTILTAHGGVLEAHHNTPRGAVFTFTLPIVGRGTAP